MFKRIFRWVVTLTVVGVLIWFLAPRTFNGEANSLLSSAVTQVQGMAQFVPAAANDLGNGKGNLQINLSGLTPAIQYELTLDRDQCGQTDTVLGTLAADANGGLYHEFALPTLDAKKSWFVDVWQQGQSVACGQLQTNQDAGAQVISAAQSGPNVFGPQPTDVPQSQSDTPAPGATPANNQNSSIVNGFPHTGTNPGTNQQYDNNQYPRKY